MAKETKEEKAARMLQEEQVQLAALATYRASIPKRMMEAQALAESVGVSVRVTLIDSGPKLTFRFPYSNDEGYYMEELTYETEEWSLEGVESLLREIKGEQDTKTIRRKLAEETWKNLSDLEKAAIKENIYGLR